MDQRLQVSHNNEAIALSKYTTMNSFLYPLHIVNKQSISAKLHLVIRKINQKKNEKSQLRNIISIKVKKNLRRGEKEMSVNSKR